MAPEDGAFVVIPNVSDTKCGSHKESDIGRFAQRLHHRTPRNAGARPHGANHRRIGGGVAYRCPFISICNASDATPIVAWLHKLAAGEFDDSVLLTGEGVVRLVNHFARSAGIEEPVLEALRKVRTVSRGPKPARALRTLGLRASMVADMPTTEGVITTLAREDLKGRRVGVQLFGEEPNEMLIDFLLEQGAQVFTVAPYVYVPSPDPPLLELMEKNGARRDFGHCVYQLFAGASALGVGRSRGDSSLAREGAESNLGSCRGPYRRIDPRSKGGACRRGPPALVLFAPHGQRNGGLPRRRQLRPTLYVARSPVGVIDVIYLAAHRRACPSRGAAPTRARSTRGAPLPIRRVAPAAHRPRRLPGVAPR